MAVRALSQLNKLCLNRLHNKISIPKLICSPQMRLERKLHLCLVYQKAEGTGKSLIRSDMFNVGDKERNKETFLAAINMYHIRDVQRRAHVDFIYAALKYMVEFGVQKDLQAYKQIMDVFPKGKFIPSNLIQAEFMHYPKQQECALNLLEQMENNGVMADYEFETMVRNIFGKHSFPMKKLMRMNYWMPKFRNLSPWPLPQTMPNSSLELAKMAIRRMGSVDPATEMEIFNTKDLDDSIDDTWIVSGQSPIQRELIEKMKEHQTVFVEGAFRLWMRNTSINYFILRADPTAPTSEEIKNFSSFDFDDTSKIRSSILGDEEVKGKDVIIPPSVHEQEDGTILAVGITGTSSKDSLLSWIRFLQVKNPHLANLPVLFATHSPLGEVILAIDSTKSDQPTQQTITDGTET